MRFLRITNSIWLFFILWLMPTFAWAGSMTLLGAGGSVIGATFTTPLGIVSDGDSITVGFGATYGYPEYFSTSANVAKINKGISGQHLSAMVTSYASNIAPLYSANGFNTLTADGGTNDIFTGSTAATLEGQIQSYCSSAHTTGYKVYITTLISRADTGWTGAMETVRQTYNTWLRANFGSFSDGLIDFDAIPQSQNPADATYFQADELHPTDALQSIMGIYLQNKFIGLPLTTYAYNTTPFAGTATFSNSNKVFLTTTALATTISSSNSISGKKVFAANLEINSGSDAVTGIGTSSSTNANGIGFDSNQSVGYYDNGSLIQNNAFALGAGTLPVFTSNNSLIGVVVDTAAKLLWITRDGVNFYGSSSTVRTAANVAAGVGGYDWSAIVGTVFPLMGGITTSGDQWRTIAYPWVIPSGFGEL